MKREAEQHKITVEFVSFGVKIVKKAVNPRDVYGTNLLSPFEAFQKAGFTQSAQNVDAENAKLKLLA